MGNTYDYKSGLEGIKGRECENLAGFGRESWLAQCLSSEVIAAIGAVI